MTIKVTPSRVVAGLLGGVAGGLSAYGAYEMQVGLEQAINYLVIAAPFVVIGGGVIPPLAEAVWQRREFVKATLWWLVLLPVIALAGLSSFERVHYSKAKASAERGAYQKRVARTAAELEDAKSELKEATKEADEARGWKKQGPNYRARIARETTAKAAVAESEAKLLQHDGEAIAEAALAVPPWLLPGCIELIGFMGIWTAFAPSKPPKPKRKPWRLFQRRKAKKGETAPKVKAKRKPRKAAPVKPKPPLEGMIRKAGNDNVVPFPAA